ncbi:uncharacterized protein LOC136025929 isoform X2 [Artemia franciscana]|uniref:uncharacterized protein LOC136025929 isoform X2 n=1 Tax=Artemia franciscana TaxID=6661 RepID=UPI0032DB8173
MMSNLNLPEEIYDVIFAYLSLGDVLNCLQVCKKWYYILERGNSELWQYHSGKTVPCEALGSEILSSLSSHKSKLKAFKYAWNPNDCAFHNYIKSNGLTLLRYPEDILHSRYPIADYRRALCYRCLRDCARGKLGFEAGRHPWEITWEGSLGFQAIVGVPTKDDSNSNPDYLFGPRGESWGWDLARNRLIQNGLVQKHHSGAAVFYPQSPKWEKSPCGPNYQMLPTYQIGDRIRVILDLEENTLAFEINNKFLGVAFRGLPKKRLFPAVYGMQGLEASQKHGVDAIPAVSMVYLGAHFNALCSTSESSSSGSRSSSNSGSSSKFDSDDFQSEDQGATATTKAPVQQLTSKGVAFQNKRTPTGVPAASTRPMATKTRNLGHTTSIVTCTAAKPKRTRELDSTPDEFLEKRPREEELSQEPVTQTPESIQRVADLRRSLLGGRRTTGLAVAVEEGLRSTVFRPSSSATKEIEISSESANENGGGNDGN